MKKDGEKLISGAFGTKFWAFRMFGPRDRRRAHPHGGAGPNDQERRDGDEPIDVALGATWNVSAEFARLAKRVFRSESPNGPDPERSEQIAAILRRAADEIDAL